MEDTELNISTNEDSATLSDAASQREEFDRLLKRDKGDDRKVAESTETAVEMPSQRESAEEPIANDKRVEGKKAAEEKVKGKGDRYGEMTRKFHKAVARAEAAERQLKEFQASQKPIDKTQYDNVESWLKDSIAAETKAKLLEEQAAYAAQQTQEVESELWTERCREQVSNFDDFAEQYNKYVGNIDEITAGFVADSEHGPKILEDFFKHANANKHFLTVWQSLPTADKYKTLISLEQYVSQPKQAVKQAKVETKPVPRPIAPDGNGSSSEPIGQQELFNQLFNSRKR